MKKEFLLGAVLLAISVAISGCKSTQKIVVSEPVLLSVPEYPREIFQHVDVIGPEQLFELTEEQLLDFREYYYNDIRADVPGNMRLYDYLDLQTDGFSYKGETFTAAQAYDRLEGNCLSLAILTAAIAKAVDIDITYEKVNSTPVYQKFGNVMTVGVHVRTFLYDPSFVPEEGAILLTRPSIVVDYFPETGNIRGNRVTHNDFIAMYYQNLAGKAIIDQDFDLAHALIRQGLDVSPTNPESLNTLAVILQKKGELIVAEDIYQYLLETGTGSVNTLTNYAILKEKLGDTQGARTLLARVDRIEDGNPYKWISVAEQQMLKREYAIARKYFIKAIEAAPYLAQSYHGLAKTYYEAGEPQQALTFMRRATELVYVPEEEAMYQAKL